MKVQTLQFQSYLIACMLILALGQMAQATTKYVKPTASGSGDGSSWANASDDLQAMIDAAGTTEVWVAAGTYKPTTGTDRTVSFVMKNGVAIYGGFNGTETQLSQRDWETNVTILSGDIGTVGDNADNSYHVIFNNNNGLDSTAILDGFTITGGNANDSTLPHSFGGGMYNNSSSPVVINCIFSGNSAATAGGGMYNYPSSSPELTNCTFSGNSAAYFGGGMLNFDSSSPELTNCSFSGNSAVYGGGMYNIDSSPEVTNCIFWGNSSEIGNDNSSPVVTYSIVQGGYTGTGNLNQDPFFVNQPAYSNAPTTAGDLHLQACSPALDAGNDAANTESFDLDGNNRKYEAFAGGSIIDMGAYEFQSQGVMPTTYYTDADGDSYGTGVGQEFCTNPGAGWATQDGDCDDSDANVHPGATEVCNGKDDDCDSLVDTADPGLVDNTPPSVTCKAYTAVLDGNGSASITPSDVYDSGSDNCGTVNLVDVLPNTFDCGDLGSNTVTLTVNDGKGNSATCTATVTVEDNTVPSVLCKAYTAVLDGNGSASITPYHVYDSGSDNCGTVNLVDVMPNTFDCGDLGSNTVTLTVNDGNGNSATCTATVTVEDNTVPSVLCKAYTAVLDGNGSASITPSDVYDSGSDNCGTVNLVGVLPNTFDCGDLGNHTVTLTVNDGNGNSATCTATVTVEDNTVPSVLCKAYTAVLDGNGSASITPSDVYDSGSDNCGTVNLVGVMPNTFGCGDLGNNTVTLTVNDGNGNSATCTATVTVEDNTAPVASCPATIADVVLDANGNGTLPANIGDGSSTDNCSATETSPTVSFSCADVGVQTVTLTATDGSGNTDTATCSFNVVDSTPPVAQCQNFTTDLDPDGTYNLPASQIDNGSSDNCGISSLSVSPSSFDCSNVGANTVTLTVTDASSHQATCNATLTINTFLNISNVLVTDESCQGYSDGEIAIMANATGGGQLRYSIDGGATFQLTNLFGDLSPGTYSIVVELSGNGTCSATATAVLNAGSPPSTWYKDLDGDGYTDGMTQVSCSAPAGYVSSAQPGDCDDSDASIHPGATELCNGIDDNCDGIIPADEQDNDGDGYRVCDGDCDDSDPAVNPGAAEVCNGIDDNCDGQIDEGNPPANQVHVGNVVFTSQAAVDNFSPCYYKIQGSLIIQGTGINSLANLSNLQEVTGNVTIQITSLPDLSGLDGLTTIGATLTIKLNNYGAKLTSLSGLGNLTSIGQNLFIYFNFSLSDCCSIDDLLSNAGVGGVTSIHHNASGCNSVADIGTSCGGSIIVVSGDGIAWGEQAEGPKIGLLPNPAGNRFNILLSSLPEGNNRLEIVDGTGRLMHRQVLSPGTHDLEFTTEKLRMPPGMYTVLLTTSRGRVFERLIIN